MKKNVKYMEEWKGEGGDTQGQNEERMRQSERERGGGDCRSCNCCKLVGGVS